MKMSKTIKIRLIALALMGAVTVAIYLLAKLMSFLLAVFGLDAVVIGVFGIIIFSLLFNLFSSIVEVYYRHNKEEEK